MDRRKTVRRSEIGIKWQWASSVECSRRLRESVDDSNMVKGGSAKKCASGGEPEKSAEDEVADTGICVGIGSEGRADGWGYNKTKHDECPDVQAVNRKNVNEDRWLFPLIGITRSRALNYLDKCAQTSRHRLWVPDSRFGVIAKYFEISGNATSAFLCREGFVYCWRALVHWQSHFVFEMIFALEAYRRSQINSTSTVKHL